MPANFDILLREPLKEAFRSDVRERFELSGGLSDATVYRVRSQKAVTKKEMSVKISELAEAKHLR